MGSIVSAVSTMWYSSSLANTNATCFNTIIDSRATMHMVPFKAAFICYHSTPRGFVILADKTHISSVGIGTMRIHLGPAAVELINVLHVPSLCASLFSVRHHRKCSGCAFIADNSGTFLTFSTFILPVGDSSDCIIPSQLIDHPALCRLVHYSECENYSTSAVSDGMHNRTG